MKKLTTFSETNKQRVGGETSFLQRHQIIHRGSKQDVTHRSESTIGNLIDKSILLDFTR